MKLTCSVVSPELLLCGILKLCGFGWVATPSTAKYPALWSHLAPSLSLTLNSVASLYLAQLRRSALSRSVLLLCSLPVKLNAFLFGNAFSRIHEKSVMKGEKLIILFGN
jgi:hypothetical protein